MTNWDDPTERVDLSKSSDEPSNAPLDFDPYRFGLPDHPVPPEYAPPGYIPPAPDPAAQPPAAFPQHQPFGGPGTNAYGNPASGWQAPPPTYPQQGYPQQGYPRHGPANQGPPPGYGYGYPQPHDPMQGRRNHGKAVTALVLGILSIVFCWLTWLDAFLIIPALIFAIITVSDKRSEGRRMAIAGLACAIVGAIAAVLLFIWLLPIARECGDLGGAQQRTCVEHHL